MRDKLNKLRRVIDKIDLCILELLNLRAKLATIINKHKEEEGISSFSPAREKEILRNLTKKNKGPLSNVAIEDIYRQILSYTRSLLSSIKVGYIGEEGSFSNLAAIKHFGLAAEYISYPDIKQVFLGVENNSVNFCVVPSESFIESSTYTKNIFLEENFINIVGEIKLGSVRFLILSSEPVASYPTGYDKTSILISIKDKARVLNDILSTFKKWNINLTKIELCPKNSSSEKICDYVFFIDFEGHKDESNIKKALEEIKLLCTTYKLLGSYPAA